jgi:hypothetical protein
VETGSGRNSTEIRLTKMHLPGECPGWGGRWGMPAGGVGWADQGEVLNNENQIPFQRDTTLDKNTQIETFTYTSPSYKNNPIAKITSKSNFEPYGWHMVQVTLKIIVPKY